MISHRCSLCSPRVAGRLAFPASSLALHPTRSPGRSGPSRSSARHRRWIHIAANPPSTLSSAPLRSSHLPPGPAHADLLSWGWTRPEGSPHPPLPVAPPSTVLSDASFEVTARVHSRIGTFALLLRLRDATPEVPFRPRGFAPPRRLSPRTARRLVASCCRPWGSSRFLLGRNRAFPATLPPLEELHRPAVGTPVTRRLGPLDVPPLARLSPSRLFPSNQLGTATPVAGRRCPGSSWASISSSRFP